MTLPIQHLFSEHTENHSLTLLKQHFPQCFDKDGAFLPEKMAEQLQSADVPVNREYYTLNWLGKSYARYLRDCPPTTLLSEDAAHNQLAQNQNSQNLLIKGDNLEVLKHLKNAYASKVKMIYIDPPYNTGSDGFVYQDDRKFTPEQLAQLANMSVEEAQRVLDFTAKKSNSHSAWLTFMYPRLYIARELLRDDGVIFISIDDNEQAQLKLLCDEVFGEANFIACLPTIMNLKGNNDEFAFAGTHEYTYVYTKQKNYSKFYQFEVSEDEITEWQEDDKGFFKMGSGLLATSEGKFREERPYMYFPILIKDERIFLIDRNEYKKIYDKETNLFNDCFIDSLIEKYNRLGYEVILPIDSKGKKLRWTWGYDGKFSSEIDEVIINKTKNGISLHKKQRPLLGDLPSKKPKTIFYKPEYSSGNGTNQINYFFQTKAFNNPKPLELIKDFCIIGLNKTDIILDFFAGSGTTAHAVMQLNAEDGRNRQFICVQLPEATGEKSEAYKAGYQTIFDITKARIEKSAVKIQQDFPDYQGDLGFKIFETVPDFCHSLMDKDDFSPQLVLPETLHATFSPEQYATLLTTWRVYDGNLLTDDVQAVRLSDYIANLCGITLYLIYPDFNSKAIKALLDKLDNDANFIIERIVLFGATIESAKQRELKQALDTYNNKKNMHLSLLVRY